MLFVANYFYVTKMQTKTFYHSCMKRMQNGVAVAQNDTEAVLQAWQESFLNGLMKSRVIVLLISSSGIERIKKAHKNQDNVLLEYEYALQR